jgi:hypothetical protein
MGTYLINKGLLAAYILYKAYRFLFGKRITDFWRFMLPENNINEEPAKPDSVVGKSQTVYLEEPPKEETKAIKPAFSEDLKMEKSYEEEPDITDNDVVEEIPPENERFIPPEELDEAFADEPNPEILSIPLDDDTAETLTALENTNMFEILVSGDEGKMNWIKAVVERNILRDIYLKILEKLKNCCIFAPYYIYKNDLSK